MRKSVNILHYTGISKHNQLKKKLIIIKWTINSPSTKISNTHFCTCEPLGWKWNEPQYPKKSNLYFVTRIFLLKIKKNQSINQTENCRTEILLWLNKNSSLQEAALYKIPHDFHRFFYIVTMVLWTCTERTAINIYHTRLSRSTFNLAIH